MTDEFEAAGDFAVDTDKRTVRGLLVPYGELSRLSVSGVPPIKFARGKVAVPRDVTILNANDNHDRTKPMARFTGLTDTEKGLVADFAIGNTPEGDRFLADYAAGRKMKLSPELRNISYNLQTGDAEASLCGAGFVPEGAFASSGLFAVDDTTPPEVVEPEPVKLATKTVLDPDPATGKLAVESSAVPVAVDVTVGDNITTFSPSTESEPPVPENAVVPLGAFGSQHKNPRRVGTIEAGDMGMVAGVSAAMAKYAATKDKSVLDALGFEAAGLFALSAIKLTTGGSVGVNIQQAQFLGQLWAGRRYARRYAPLIGHADLKSFKVAGWDWTTAPAMATWAGDKSAVPSNAPATESKTFNAKRWAGGHDIAREYRDFDVPEFWDAYFASMTDSYAALVDADVLATLVAGATAVVAGAVPTDVDPGIAAIVDGAMAVLPLGIPTFAIVTPAVYRNLLLTRTEDTLAFLNIGLGLEEGTIEKFTIVPGTLSGTAKALVGISGAATLYELPGVPIRTEALDQVLGGIDEALFGYSVTIIENPQALALVSPAA